MDLPGKQGDLLENGTVPPSGPTVEELAETLRVLKKITEFSLIALLFFAVGVNAYMYRQTLMISRQLAEVKRVVADYQQFKESTIRGFISSLQGFAKSHPDFLPLLAKYNIEPPSLRPAIAPTNAPAPRGAK